MVLLDNGSLFLRVPKTGSTSCAAALRAEQKVNKATIIDGIDFGNLNIPKDVRQRAKKCNIKLHHATPTELVEVGLFSQEELDSFKIFAVIRNPIERALSSYCYSVREKRGSKEHFWTWVRERKFEPLAFCKQFPYFSQPNTDILLYESLEKEMKDRFQVGIPKLNVSYRHKLDGWITDEMQELLREYYKEDVKLWESMQ